MTTVDALMEEQMQVSSYNIILIPQKKGHTIIKNGKKLIFHVLPCGLGYEKVKNIIGNGVVINLP